MELLLSQKLRARKRLNGKARGNDADNFHGVALNHRTGADETPLNLNICFEGCTGG
jgi:hypothetical protein